MATYKPRIAKTPEGNEQQIDANITHVSKGLIALGELKPDRGKELKFGTPIHSVLLHCTKGDLVLELNDQSNSCELWKIAVIELAAKSLRVLFIKGHGPKSGRVSLSPAIEIFDRDAHKPVKLGALRIAMSPTAAQLRRIKTMLRAAAGDKLETRL